MTSFNPNRGSGWQRNRACIAEKLHCRKIDVRGEPNSIEQQLAMYLSNLMSKDLIDVGWLPAEFRLEAFPCRSGEFDPGMELCFWVCLHTRSPVTVLRLDATCTEAVVACVC